MRFYYFWRKALKSFETKSKKAKFPTNAKKPDSDGKRNWVMRKMPPASRNMDEIVSGVALGFLVIFTIVAALHYISIWLTLGGYALFGITLIIAGCFLPNEQQVQGVGQKHETSSNSDFEQALAEVTRLSGTPARESSVDDVLSLSNGSRRLRFGAQDLSKRRRSRCRLNRRTNRSRYDRN